MSPNEAEVGRWARWEEMATDVVKRQADMEWLFKAAQVRDCAEELEETHRVLDDSEGPEPWAARCLLGRLLPVERFPEDAPIA
jgi:hypothetical protein